MYSWSPYPGYWKSSFRANYFASETIEKKEWYNSYYLDIYIMMVSSVHSISKAGYYVAIVSTTVETNNPHQEI